MTASTKTTAAAILTTNQHDHTIGHCRAQRQTLYSCSELCAPVQLQPNQKPVVSTLQGSEDEWTESHEELERWGMEVTETTKPEASQATTPNDTHGCGLKFEEVTKFWQ
jgi:16S rRNA G527 N7-methylase RsmG